MFADQIETLKRQYTDKYVVVDESRPKLRRFRGATGLIKTVNMNGRALVQFDLYNDIGWHDIALEYLRVVDAPPPKVEEKKPERKPAAKTPDKSVTEKIAAPSADSSGRPPLPKEKAKPAKAPRPRETRNRSKKSSPPLAPPSPRPPPAAAKAGSSEAAGRQAGNDGEIEHG